jgi:hypothetical protein
MISPGTTRGLFLILICAQLVAAKNKTAPNEQIVTCPDFPLKKLFNESSGPLAFFSFDMNQSSVKVEVKNELIFTEAGGDVPAIRHDSGSYFEWVAT